MKTLSRLVARDVVVLLPRASRVLRIEMVRGGLRCYLHAVDGAIEVAGVLGARRAELILGLALRHVKWLQSVCRQWIDAAI